MHATFGVKHDMGSGGALATQESTVASLAVTSGQHWKIALRLVELVRGPVQPENTDELSVAADEVNNSSLHCSAPTADAAAQLFCLAGNQHPSSCDACQIGSRHSQRRARGAACRQRFKQLIRTASIGLCERWERNRATGATAYDRVPLRLVQKCQLRDQQ